jgi:hypothetical protein
MRIIATAFALLAIAGWGSLVLTGSSVIASIAGQHAPGYPNIAQILLFVGVPVAVVLALIVGIVSVHRKKRKAPLLICAALLSLLCVLPFITFYAGGV